MASKLMIVAHPDDESIFGGSLLCKYPGWKVVCVTNGNNHVRKEEFIRVMNSLGAEYEIWSYPDCWSCGFDYKRLKKDLTKVIRSKRWRAILTHNRAGEYGHLQHRIISQIMHQIVRENLYVFKLSACKLNQIDLRKKRRLLKYYKSQPVYEWNKYILYEGIKKVC